MAEIKRIKKQILQGNKYNTEFVTENIDGFKQPYAMIEAYNQVGVPANKN